MNEYLKTIIQTITELINQMREEKDRRNDGDLARLFHKVNFSASLAESF